MNELQGIATLVIIGITAFASYRAFKDQKLLDALVFSPAHILQDKEFHRLLTSGLIHADWMHFFFNMFSLYSFGSAIEITFGPHILLLIYLSSILGGSLLSLYLHRHHDYRALGASGGVCGVIFAAIFLLPGGGVIIFPLPMAVPSWLYAILFILVSFFGMRSQVGNIGHDAHLGGALLGLALATAIHPSIIFNSPVLYLAVVSISAILLVYAYRYPLQSETSHVLNKEHWREVWKSCKSGCMREARRYDKETVDRLLIKVSDGGLGSLSDSEKRQLKAISKRKKKSQC